LSSRYRLGNIEVCWGDYEDGGAQTSGLDGTSGVRLTNLVGTLSRNPGTDPGLGPNLSMDLGDFQSPFRCVTWVFVCISVECMVLLNGYGRAENAWGFGQRFAMADTLVLVILICLRPHLRGTAHVDPVPWLTRRTYSFIPEPGALYRPRHRVPMVCVGLFWILCI
jgi:hypothetical protein